jgi:oligopeptide/dipeptide ABC transporter ATP-binding protein
MAPLLEVKDLKRYFPANSGVLGRGGGNIKAVDGVSFRLEAGETLGIVGESGCGKSTAGRAILGLVRPTDGEVWLRGNRVDNLSARAMRQQRREMQLIFQDPYSSLSPRMKIGSLIAEPLRNFSLASRREMADRVVDLLGKVGLRPDAADRYPYEFSGGQRQRIGIARALALNPSLIICDEPVSALDVSVQAQVINLLMDLQRELGLSYLFIAHDIAVVEHISKRIAVMYLGKLVEIADRRDLISRPLHPYTQALISAVPVPQPGKVKTFVALSGDVPSPLSPPDGCRFHTRCPLAFDKCSRVEPPLVDVVPGHSVACHLHTAPMANATEGTP